MCVPVLSMPKPDVLSDLYLLIIFSRYIRIFRAFQICTENAKLSYSEITHEIYKTLLQIACLIVIFSLLFAGIENQ